MEKAKGEIGKWSKSSWMLEFCYKFKYLSNGITYFTDQNYFGKDEHELEQYQSISTVNRCMCIRRHW